MDRKLALYAFNGEAMCFVHVLLNALDLHAKGFSVKVVIEGAATKLIPELAKEDHFLAGFYAKAVGLGLIEGACRACATKMGTLQAAQDQGLALLADMSGHPSMSRYLFEGFQIITF